MVILTIIVDSRNSRRSDILVYLYLKPRPNLKREQTIAKNGHNKL